MKYRYPIAAVFGLMIAAASPILSGAPQDDRVDEAAIARFKEEGLQRSQVVEIAAHLTDVHGPRLTNSPGLKAAADYAVTKMQAWGLSGVALEPWGPFAPGWTNERFVAHVVKPYEAPLIGLPKAWSPGTDEPITADAVMAVIESEADLEKHRGKLAGKFVLTQKIAEQPPLFAPLARRFTDADLKELADAGPTPPRPIPPLNIGFLRQRMQFYMSEKVAGLIEPGRGSGGTFFVETGVASRDRRDYDVPPSVVLTPEHYNRIARTLQRNVPVTLEIDISNTFYTEDLNSFTVVGEIPGTDKADELVMIGAHLDSWHGGTGATDNAAGVAVMLEAMRILKASGLKPRRTIRVALWTAEEQGRLGSRAYARQHFGDYQKMTLKPAHEKFSVYFNLDLGAGAIRGVYLQGNADVAPVFKAWMAPFAGMGMTTVTLRDMGGTDHQTFDELGLPGFQFIQDPLEYPTRTHHFNMDVFDRLPPQDLMQNAVIVASFAYHAANREAKLPRKPLPTPATPARTGGGDERRPPVY